MRISKYTILMIVSLMLIEIGCGKKEGNVPSAAERMRKNKKVTIITEGVNAPFEYGSGTSVQGLGVDVGNEIGKTLNIEVNWVTLQSVENAQSKLRGYDHLFEILKNSEAEMIISSVGIDPNRENEFAFSRPYYDTGDVIAHQRTVFDIKDLASLSGKKVGVCAGRLGDSFMSTQKTATNVTIKRYRYLDDVLGGLSSTEIDAAFGDEVIMANSVFNNFSGTTLLPNEIDKFQYAVVVRKGEDELLAKINETIDRMKTSGDLDKLKEKWVGNIVSKAIGRGQEDKAIEEKKKAAKTINVKITKVSGAWNMDGLDGFQLQLEGPAGTYKSTPILTEGNRGNCKFTTPVPPGEYKLQMPMSRTPAKVPVLDYPKTSLEMEMNISGGTTSVIVK
ncbi:MAG: ABC transporter substrate-binding protein [Acidobacteriota bacterium]